MVSGGDKTSEFLSGDTESVISLRSAPHKQNEEEMGGVSEAPLILGSVWASHYKKDTELPGRRCRELSLQQTISRTSRSPNFRCSAFSTSTESLGHKNM